MAAAIYSLCSLVALVCTFLLLRAYASSRLRLLLWSGLCFAGLTANNVLLFLDKIVFTEIDLSLCRTVVAVAAMMVLLYGLIWDAH
ncbi:DUF5985 family protein [Reyranella sp.]|jgi:hypothetical protein|uniref:DUF5985 family protein n=1 Tax=Reyranella sp. TaxID=1929291 RepID=UPI002F94CD41